MTTRIAPGVGANLLGQHSAERNQDATAYVGNLDPQITEELLWELFVQAGPVDRVTNLHQGYGFVEFRSEDDADYAIKVLNMIKLYGKPIRVNKASQDKKSLDVGANLFVGNLDPDVDEKLLYDTFSAFGVIVTNPKGVLHLVARIAEVAHKSVKEVRFFQNRKSKARETQIMPVGPDYRVLGGGQSWSRCKPGLICARSCMNLNKCLTQVLACLGLGTSGIMRDPETGNSRGFGFISYDSFDASDAAIEAMNGQYLCNRQITVSYAYKKDTKGERHGTPAERVLAASNPGTQRSRPHTLFASGPPTLPNAPQANGTMGTPIPMRPFANGTVPPPPITPLRAPPQGGVFPPMPMPGPPSWQGQPQQPGQHMPPPPLQQFRPPPPNMPPPPPQAAPAFARQPPPPTGMAAPPPVWRPPPPPQQLAGRPHFMPQMSMPPPPPLNAPPPPPPSS
ncbi:unnamed protein product [Camellia sinensis]